MPVNFSSMLVDLDPTLPNTSQLFFDDLTVGIQGGPRIHMPNNGPMVARYINFGRNPSLEIAGTASVIWQASCVEGLFLDVSDSPVLVAMKESIDSGAADGLTVRINAYRTIYFDGPPVPANLDDRFTALRDRVKGGGFQPNPARSLIVGAVGLHRHGEPPAVPGDRQLSGNLGTAFARLDRDTKQLTVDLANTVPETDFAATKADLGELPVAAGDTLLGTLDYGDYDQVAYRETAGLVTIDLDDDLLDAAESSDLALSSSSTQAAITEQSLTAVVEPPNVYLEGADRASVVVQILRHGVPVTEQIRVQVAEVQRSIPAPAPQMQLQVVDTDAQGRVRLTFSSDGSTSLQVYPGSSQWVLTPFEGSAPAAPTSTDNARDCYVATRVTPADDDIAALPPTWANVYQHVLIDWHALAPCMDNWLPLGNEAECRRMAAVIKALTSVDHFDNFDYMPVTRGMTKGQRTLLHKWCDDTAPPGPATALITEDATTTELPIASETTPIDLSRGFSSPDPMG
ncbi:MAG: hypothetical protein ACR2QE_21620 [Acidimicrobiales bacterium]